MKFAFIHAEKAFHSVSALCAILGVSRQGYYAWAAREPSQRLVEEQKLRGNIARVFDQSRGTYGSPRVRAELRREGTHTSKRRIERAMRELDLVARRRRRFVRTTQADGAHPVAPNVLRRDFTASAPDERWVTDITYVSTDEGWAYIAVILDLYSRAVVGWALADSLDTSLPLAALRDALRRRRPARGLLHHSDRGCQYTSREYRDELAKRGIDVSMSRKGNCWDNAVAESFFATLKTELVERRRWSSRVELRSAVFDYIEVFYNRRPVARVRAIAVDPTGILYAALYGVGVYRSVDGGATFAKLGAPNVANDPPYTTVTTLALNALGEPVVGMAPPGSGTSKTLMARFDAKQNAWVTATVSHPINLGGYFPPAIRHDVDGALLSSWPFRNDIMRSLDNGSTWTNAFLQSPTPRTRRHRVLRRASRPSTALRVTARQVSFLRARRATNGGARPIAARAGR